MKFPNIQLLNGQLTGSQKKEVSATQLQLFPQSKPGLQNYSLQASLVEEEFSKGRGGRGCRYENNLRQTGSKTGKNHFQNNMFAQSYGFQEAMQQTQQQDFSSLDRAAQTKSQKKQLESPLLQKHFQEDQSVSLRIQDEQAPPAKPQRDQGLAKRKTSIGKRTLNYSQIDHTRNNPAPYTSSSFFSSAQNALLNITSQSRQSSQH